ncbi:MAG: hypothetical protein ABIA47_03840 [bacterium]
MVIKMISETARLGNLCQLCYCVFSIFTKEDRMASIKDRKNMGKIAKKVNTVDGRVLKALQDMDRNMASFQELRDGYEHWQWNLFAKWHLDGDYALAGPSLLRGLDLSMSALGSDKHQPFANRGGEYTSDNKPERMYMSKDIVRMIAHGERRAATKAVEQELLRRRCAKQPQAGRRR